MKPNLFIVGAPKCGTTAWVEYLRTHPDIFFSPLKEPHYFCTDFPEHRRVRREEEYLSLFHAAASERIIAEASASYLYSQEAAANLRAFAPDARIIIFVRDRAQLLFSWHNQLLYTRFENRSDFADAWSISGKRSCDDHGPACTERSFLDYKSIGLLGSQVERFFRHFPAERIRVFHFRDWSANPRATYLEILKFLDLQDDGRIDFHRVNEAKRVRSNAFQLFLLRPPRLAATAYHIFRMFTGWDASSLAGKLIRLNSRKGYGGRISAELRDNIQRYYEDDEVALSARIWKPHA